MTSKVTDLVCYLLFRLLLPVTLLAATVVRFNGLSFLYLIFLLISILLSTPTPENIKGLTGLYLKLLIVVGALGSLAQAVFHIVLGALATDSEPYGYAFPNCSTNEKIARQLGVERLNDVPVYHAVRLVAPDAAVLIVSILVFVVCYKFLSSAKPAAGSQTSLPTTVPKIRRKRRFNDIVVFIGEFLVVLFLAASGIIVPSVISAIYFLSFLCAATWWSFYRRLGRGFAFFRTFLLVWNILHMLILYLYQFQFFQEVLPPDDFIPRLLGLTGIIKTDCGRPWALEFHDVSKWPYFVNPAILFVLYIVLAVETKHWKNRQETVSDDEAGKSPTEKSKKRRQRKPLERQVLPTDSKSQAENLVEEGDGQSYNTFEDTGTPTMYESDPEDVVDGIDETEPKKKLVKRKEEKRSAMVSIFVYVMKQSYVLSLIAMMAWSITFHSWLTFVLLLVACIIWMIPKSRKACQILSPVILFYGEILLIIQFIYGLDLTESELPSKAGDIKLDEIGLKRFPYPCLQLGLQIIFTATFWLTMRQFMRERRLPPEQTSGYAMGPVHKDSVSPSIRTLLSDFLWTLLAKYWIFVCAGMMLLISLQDVVIYRIIYLIFVLYFFLSFQLWYSLWRITMKIYWWCVIIYSMAVLIMLYTYQFSDFPSYWRNGTGLAEETIHDIGLELFDTAGLFVKLLTPTSFLILIIIQVHYFHRPFLVLSDLDKYKKDETLAPGTPLGLHTDTEGNTTDTTDGKILKKVKGWRRKFRHYFVIVWNKCSDVWGWLSVMLWRIAEIHMFKVVAFTVVMVSVTEVSAITAVYIILLCILMPIPGARMLFSHLAQFWTGLVMLSKMIYQLRLVEKDYWISNCTADNGTVLPTSSPFAQTIDNANWVGFDKTSDLTYYLRRFVAILLIIAFERIVIYHQRQHFNAPGFPKPHTGIIFPEIKRRDADKNIKNCCKFFANYFFYKYGLEICYIMSAITISVRLDVYSLIYAIFLGILLLLSRRGNARIWPLYTIILAVLLPVQFLLRLGFPLGLCLEYPWDGHSYVDRNLEKWLFLPDYEYPQNAFKFVADFFQLLFVCLQWQVFRKEKSDNMENYGGGDNQDILPEVEGNTPIPVEDFTSSIDSYLDVIKFAIFVYLFWVTLFIVFITGTARINIFSMGYVIAVFCFMWYGQEFILLPLRKIRRRWCMLIGYTYFVLLLKAALQLLGCVYIDYLYENQCWLIQLLGLTCLNPSNEYLPGQGVKHCEVERDNTGLMWDVICFTFLLLQLRIYNSQYFRHVVASAEAQSRLASRGAELINSILIKDVLKQKEDEKIVLYNIKKKMEVLKKKQAHKKEDFIEPDEHFQAIRSGDYFLFDDDSDKEEGPDTLTLGQDDEDAKGKADPLKLITTALDSGTKAAVDKADDIEEKKSLDKVDIQKEKKSTSSDTESEEEEEEVGSEKDSIFNKVKNILKLILRVLESFADWLIEKCNGISRNYRLVARKLEKEMKTEKEKIQAEKQSLAVAERTIDVDSSGAEDGGIEDDGQPSSDTVDLLEVKVQPGKRIQKPPSEISLAEPQEDKTKFESSKPKIYLLLEACFYVIISRSELVCYFLMVLDQILNASLLSLPLPLMVFLWGMLSVPRPSKTFWITVITYTEAVVVIKYLFQFNFFPWNDLTEVETSPFWPPRILGIEKQKNYAAPELVLLLALFIHRSILKRYGLWKDAEDITADFKEAEEIYMSRPASPVSGAEDDADVSRSIEEGKPSTSQQLTSIEESGQSGIEEEPKKKKKIKSKFLSYAQPLRDFYKQLTNPMYNATTDVYAPMFACDFIGFLIVVFGYWAFGPAESGTGDVSSYISENKIPVLFLVMLVTLFVFIIIDRALYLRKNVLGKFIFQIFLVIFIHIYMFFILPAVTGRKFSENVPAQLLYFIKCVYFGLSAYQIRSGYPTRILGNFLTKKYNYLNLFLFKGFLAIPFLLELRVLMDWIWTDSTLAIGSWLTMEDIYANIYILKCWREAERKYPTPRGYKKRALIKYGLGGVLLFAIIFIIWFPLVIFSFANTVFIANPPIECTITIAVGGFQPLFKMTAQQQYITSISTFQYNTLKNHYSKSPAALGFLDGFDPKDISEIKLNGRSSSVWGISPPSQKALVDSLSSSSEQDQLEFYVSFSRIPSSGDAGESLSNQFLLKLDQPTQQRMADMVNGTAGVNNVTIYGLFPRFIHLGSKGRAEAELVLPREYSNISLSLKSEGKPPGVVEQWWEAEEVMCGDIFTPGTCASGQNLPTMPDLTIVTFNDRVAPQGFSIITGYGIIGLYVSLVIVVGRFIRVFVTGQSYRVMFEELPNVDNILNLCMDIYMVRESGDFLLEEDLFAKLLFVYRCPEILIKWTKYKRE